MYIGGMRARGSGARIGYRWIAERPEIVRLALISGVTRSPVTVARPEALWVLKLLAGRPQDITDLFGISSRGVDHSEVRDELASLLDAPVHAQLKKVVSRVETDAEYRDALSRRGMGSPKDPRNIARRHDFKHLVRDCLPASEDQ